MPMAPCRQSRHGRPLGSRLLRHAAHGRRARLGCVDRHGHHGHHGHHVRGADRARHAVVAGQWRPSGCHCQIHCRSHRPGLVQVLALERVLAQRHRFHRLACWRPGCASRHLGDCGRRPGHCGRRGCLRGLRVLPCRVGALRHAVCGRRHCAARGPRSDALTGEGCSRPLRHDGLRGLRRVRPGGRGYHRCGHHVAAHRGLPATVRAA